MHTHGKLDWRELAAYAAIAYIVAMGALRAVEVIVRHEVRAQLEVHH